MIDRRYLRYFDWFSFAITLILLAIGLLFVFSSTYTPEKPFSIFFKKLLIGMLSGILIYLFFCIKDLRFFKKAGGIIYFGILIVLIYTLIINSLSGIGAKRWLSLYFFTFQPSELTKLFLPSFIAFYLSDQLPPKFPQLQTEVPFKRFIFPLITLFVSFILINKQPDLGTALIIFLSGLIIFWFTGINKYFFIISGAIILVSAPLLWTALKPYQKQRILVLLGQGDVKKERYQLEQSKIAIGSGGFTGKGLFKGTQNKFAFLPEDHTDFIFAVICEETGFLGALIILLLFSLLFFRIILITSQLNDTFDQIVSVGLLSHLMLSVCINIGMVSGILPIVGIPLPLISYGLTHLWVDLASLGWLNNIAIRRFYY